MSTTGPETETVSDPEGITSAGNLNVFCYVII